VELRFLRVEIAAHDDVSVTPEPLLQAPLCAMSMESTDGTSQKGFPSNRLKKCRVGGSGFSIQCT
jgi:hypothetical protein|tara:strand:+ start:1403 stop:1597 length:195 start_codon:yes stop_codon:yes gene_type:complete